MSQETTNNKPIGEIIWHDLTATNAPELAAFYQTVVGWKSSPVSMGDYEDFNMTGANDEPIAGICHARGVNQDIPAQWLMYVRVANVDASVAACVNSGGKVITEPAMSGGVYMSVIADPAGAVMAIFNESRECNPNS